ncbi:hypothetical protein GCM10025865_00790 [Paraoerskovia sediminicola]|uniref:Uncharacterized protein n=1 Tax=Paraoerskovia sediminicola TaxID=1138587 RepID=A0ABM8FYF0_9CELL|nr:hypothetical protein [Paraoerskovia sediminicola]BDZ40780.1 hypothetical protein GCM10025865_00790 [Paraoerskovia sediminicola]
MVKIEAGPAARQVSVNVIGAALEYAHSNGGLTPNDIIELGCMTPDCLTVGTLDAVAQMAGVDPLGLLV